MPFYGSAMAFRKQLLSRILPFPNDLPVHDNWIGLISQKYGKTYFITNLYMTIGAITILFLTLHPE